MQSLVSVDYKCQCAHDTYLKKNTNVIKWAMDCFMYGMGVINRLHIANIKCRNKCVRTNL